MVVQKVYAVHKFLVPTHNMLLCECNVNFKSSVLNKASILYGKVFQIESIEMT